jgi:hypothetical protein
VTTTVHIHYQLTEEQRANRGCNDYLNDRHYSTRKHASYITLDHRRRTRRQTAFSFGGPSWMLPKVLATVTASIVWGVCGQMADVPEY